MPTSITVVLEDGRIFTSTGFEEIHAPDVLDLDNAEAMANEGLAVVPPATE